MLTLLLIVLTHHRTEHGQTEPAQSLLPSFASCSDALPPAPADTGHHGTHQQRRPHHRQPHLSPQLLGLCCHIVTTTSVSHICYHNCRGYATPPPLPILATPIMTLNQTYTPESPGGSEEVAVLDRKEDCRFESYKSEVHWMNRRCGREN